jgi:hypothetical protein
MITGRNGLTSNGAAVHSYWPASSVAPNLPSSGRRKGPLRAFCAAAQVKTLGRRKLRRPGESHD